MDLSHVKVTEPERAVGLERLRTNVSASARSILVVFGIGFVVLGGFSFQVGNLERPWFRGAAIASAVLGTLIWLFTSGPFARGFATQAAQLPWGTGLSFISPRGGLVFADASTLLLERGVMRTPARFAHVRYVADSHALELGEVLPDSDGHFGQLDVSLPPSITPAMAHALAAQLTAWWCR